MRHFLHMVTYGFGWVILSLFGSLVCAQVGADQDYYRASYFRFENYIYQPYIRSVQLYRDGFELAPALIRLNTDERLVCTFDDLEGDVKDYRYTVIHCGSNWQASNLIYTEYLSGYEENPVQEFHSSYNTIQPYTNYRFVMPSEDMGFLISGNYLLKVFLAGESEPVFTRRFMVMDPKVTIEARIKRPVIVGDRDTRQEIDFSILSERFSIEDPYRTLRVILLQNNRWDNAILDLKPRMIIDKRLDYNYDGENVFDGGNEYREFDIKSITYRSPRIRSITFEGDTLHIVLWEDEPRAYRVYHTESDINGRVYIRCEDAQDMSTECDYVKVHFFLRFPAPLADGNLYVFGSLTDNQFTREGSMTYDFDLKGYRAEMYLKQGYYNYQYLFLGNNSTRGDAGYVEGNHFETMNEYMILVYYCRPGSLYDELIGVNILNSPF
ncbi:MAG: DUF5103 domain-containing protein [Lentimicrobiaceae bacterium]|nr:DUF5103 domain-containing protein [Lentimicrobiaceae bacterium]